MELIGELVVVGEQTGVLLAERDHDGAGQRREIDDEARLEALLRVPEHVGEHEAALGVGVQVLDRLARHRGDDVARPDGRSRRHVLDDADEAHGVDGRLALGQRVHEADDAAAPPMSPFMSSMPAAGLIEMPPVSKTTPLPMKASGLARFDLAPCHCMTATRAGRTLPCATDSSVFILSSFSASTSRISTSRPTPLELLDAIGELDRAQHVGRLVDEIAGEVDAVGERALRLRTRRGPCRDRRSG